MRVRQIVALGVIIGAFGASDLARAQAASTSAQVRLVKMLLLKESHDIASESAQISRFFSTQVQIIQLSQKLATDNSRQLRLDIRRLTALETKFAQIFGTGKALALKLGAEDIQTLVAVTGLPATTPNLSVLTSEAVSNHLTITAITTSPPFGITPVSPTS
jgi:hypothetical protein